MKNFKKLIALAMATVMTVACMAITAFAVEPSVKVIKTDSENKPLVGAQLQLIKKEDSSIVSSWTTDGNGKIFTDLVTSSIYIIHEVTPANGYASAADAEFTVTGSTEDVQVATSTSLKTSVKIDTVDGSDKNVANVGVSLKEKASGSVVATWTSDASGKIVEGLTVGKTYIIHETLVPSGYVVPADVEFTVADKSTTQAQKIVNKASAATDVNGYAMSTNDTSKTKAPATVSFVQAVVPTYTDKKVNNLPCIAHYEYNGKDYAAVKTLGEADIVIYSDAEGKTAVLYLDEIVADYIGVGQATTNFGDKCGQMKLTNYDKTKTYYTADDKDGMLFVADKDGRESLMVGSALVRVNSVSTVKGLTNQHTAVPTIKDGKVVGYTCSVCKEAAIEAPNYASIPDGAFQIANTNFYFAAAKSVTTSSTVESAKTADAGIAMYAVMAMCSMGGMALIGKKKED